MPSSSPTGTYIYCIAYARPFEDERAPFHAQAVGGPQHPVRLLRFNDLAAAVSNAPARRLDIKREYLLAHEAVILEAMERSEVVPLRFGTIAKNDEEVIEKLLKGAFDTLHEQLEAIQGCVELDLKVLWNQERIFEEVVAEDDRIRALRGVIANAAINERIELGRLTSEAIAWKSDQEAQLLLDELEPLAVEVRLNRPLSDMMVLNAAFLVEKSRLADFDSSVSALGVAQEGRLIFRYTGPVPPYHFVDLSVRWEEDAHGSA
jgi:hypothetical protein